MLLIKLFHNQMLFKITFNVSNDLESFIFIGKLFQIGGP